MNYYYDTNPFDTVSPYFSAQNTSGRLAAAQYYGVTTNNSYGFCATTFYEMYSYDSAGARIAKRLRVDRQMANLQQGFNTVSVLLDANYMYDTEGRMTSQSYPSWTGYDTYGNPTVTEPGQSLSYTYDPMGRLYSLGDQAGGVISSTSYGPAGELTAMSGTWGSEGRSYNAMKQMTYLSSGSLSIGYNYSSTQNNGKITSQQDYVSGETVTYTYDSLNRLASAVTSDHPGVAQWGQSYDYDGFGNLTYQHVIKGTAPDGPEPQIGGYDLNGNATAMLDPSGLYLRASWDVENRMTAVGNNFGPSGTLYAYAPDNKRVWRGVWDGSGTQTVDEVTFWSVTGQRVATYRLVSIPVALTGQGPGVPQMFAQQTGCEYYFGGKLVQNLNGYVHADRLGSIGKYFPYGQERPTATANGTEKFGTYFRDADTGLDYADQRYHAPGQGRFLSPDPYVAMAGGATDPSNPGSWNRYAYVANDPINLKDPMGLLAESADDEDDPDPPDPVPPQRPIQPPPPKKKKPIGFPGARADLKKKDCYKLFGFDSAGAAQQAFDDVSFNSSNLGQLQIQDVGGGQQIVPTTPPPAETTGNTITVNTGYGYWISFTQVLAMDVTTGQQQLYDYLGTVNLALGVNMTSSQLSNLLLLHEFEHTTSGGNAPQESQGDFVKFNGAIYNDCIK